MLDREFLFVGMSIFLACFFVLCCNIMDRFGDFGGVEGVKESVSGMILGDGDTVRGRDEWVPGGMLQCSFHMLKQGALRVGKTFGLETSSIFDGLGGACVASVESGT